MSASLTNSAANTNTALIPATATAAIAVSSKGTSTESSATKKKIAILSRLTFETLDNTATFHLIRFISPKDAPAVKRSCRTMHQNLEVTGYYQLAAKILGWKIPEQMTTLAEVRLEFIALYKQIPAINASARNALPSATIELYNKDYQDPVNFNKAVRLYVKDNKSQLLKDFTSLWQIFMKGNAAVQAAPANTKVMEDIVVLIDHREIVDMQERPLAFAAALLRTSSADLSSTFIFENILKQLMASKLIKEAKMEFLKQILPRIMDGNIQPRFFEALLKVVPHEDAKDLLQYNIYSLIRQDVTTAKTELTAPLLKYNHITPQTLLQTVARCRSSDAAYIQVETENHAQSILGTFVYGYKLVEKKDKYKGYEKTYVKLEQMAKDAIAAEEAEKKAKEVATMGTATEFTLASAIEMVRNLKKDRDELGALGLVQKCAFIYDMLVIHVEYFFDGRTSSKLYVLTPFDSWSSKDDHEFAISWQDSGAKQVISSTNGRKIVFEIDWAASEYRINGEKATPVEGAF